MSSIYGIPCKYPDAKLALLPVPWDVTTSYGKGAYDGPQAILEASTQLDLYDLEYGDVSAQGLYWIPECADVQNWSRGGRELAEKVMELHVEDQPPSSEAQPFLSEVNGLSEKLNHYVQEQAQRVIGDGKKIGVIGGDHSVPFSAIQAVSRQVGNMGILHFDAHLDLRDRYQGFEHSHASIMHNVLEHAPQVTKVVQVGIRDFCQEEFQYAERQGDRIKTFFDTDLAQRKFAGANWKDLCAEILQPLPDKVWISLDIDGLDPRYCPNTGTPVPGGLDFNEVTYLIGALIRSGREVVGFDLVEVAPGRNGDQWDGNVGMRLLYKLSGAALSPR